MTAHYLSGVQEIYNRGDSFDKLIVMEQAWTYNGQYSLNSQATDKYGNTFFIRDQIIDFISEINNRYTNGQQFVFIVGSTEQAELIQSETVHMNGYQAVVNMPKPITAQFMVQLILKDINSYDQDILYKPMFIAGEEEEGVDIFSDSTESVDNNDWVPDTFEDADNPTSFDAVPNPEFTLDTGWEMNTNEEAGQIWDTGNEVDNEFYQEQSQQDPFEQSQQDPFEQSQQDPFEQSQHINQFDINNGYGGQDGYLGHQNDQKVEIPNNLYEYGEQDNPFEHDQKCVNAGINNEPSTPIQKVKGLFGGLKKNTTLNEVDNIDKTVVDPYSDMSSVQNISAPYRNQGDPFDLQQDPYGNQGIWGNQQYQNPYEQDNYGEYSGNPYEENEPDLRDNIDQNARNLTDVNINDAAKLFAAFANRGNSIMVTGAPGAGTSTVAYQLANILRLMNYTTLLVDFDTKGRSQTYICQANYNATDHDENRLISAVNSTSGINQYVAIASQNLHLLNLGLDIDDKPIEQMIQKNRVMKFANQAKNGHNFVVYDVPFDFAAGHLEDITTMADNIVIVTDQSSWGAMKTLLYMMNVGDEAVLETLFGKAQILFNRYRNFPRILNEKIRRPEDILKAMDKQLQEMVGGDIGYQFRSIHTCGVIPFMTQLEDGWMGKEKYQWTATKEGQAAFVDILKKIVFRDNR